MEILAWITVVPHSKGLTPADRTWPIKRGEINFSNAWTKNKTTTQLGFCSLIEENVKKLLIGNFEYTESKRESTMSNLESTVDRKFCPI